jgi:predicted RecB family nuclease
MLIEPIAIIAAHAADMMLNSLLSNQNSFSFPDFCHAFFSHSCVDFIIKQGPNARKIKQKLGRRPKSHANVMLKAPVLLGFEPDI